MSNLQLVLSKLMLLVLVSATSLNAQQLGGSTGYGVDGSNFPTTIWISAALRRRHSNTGRDTNIGNWELP